MKIPFLRKVWREIWANFLYNIIKEKRVRKTDNIIRRISRLNHLPPTSLSPSHTFFGKRAFSRMTPSSLFHLFLPLGLPLSFFIFPFPDPSNLPFFPVCNPFLPHSDFGFHIMEPFSHLVTNFQVNVLRISGIYPTLWPEPESRS